jgi:hypothetical protein
VWSWSSRRRALTIRPTTSRPPSTTTRIATRALAETAARVVSGRRPRGQTVSTSTWYEAN